MSTSHNVSKNGYSRYAQLPNPDAVKPMAVAPNVVNPAASLPQQPEAVSSDSGEYRCVYCNDIIKGYDVLRAHHTFMHSHLPFHSNETDAISRMEEKAVPVSASSSTSISLTRPKAGRTPTLKATARKSSLARHLRFSAGKTAKSRLHSPPVTLPSSSSYDSDTEDSDSRSNTGQGNDHDDDVNISHLTTVVDLGCGPIKIAVSHFFELFNSRPKVMLVDISDTLDE